MKYYENQFVIVLTIDNLGDAVIEDHHEDLWEYGPDGLYRYLLDRFKYDLMKSFDVHPAEFEEFMSGLSATVDKISAIHIAYSPMEIMKVTIHKRNCKKCKKPCGLAFQYCDGTGKSNGTCTDCGTAEHRHTAECSYNRLEG